MLYLKMVIATGIALYVGLLTYGITRQLLDLAFPP